MPQLISYLFINVISNNGFWIFYISLNYVMWLVIMSFWNKLNFSFRYLNWFFQTTHYHRWELGFLNNYLFSRHPNFPWSKYIMLLTTIGCGGGGWLKLIPWQYFLNCLTLFMKMISYQKKLNYFGPIIIFSCTITISLSIIIKWHSSLRY